MHSPDVQAGVAELLRTLQLPAADVPLAQQLATAKQVVLLATPVGGCTCQPPYAVLELPKPWTLCQLRHLSDVESSKGERRPWKGHVQVLAEDVLPALKHAPQPHAKCATGMDFACLPLGFTTGGATPQIVDLRTMNGHQLSPWVGLGPSTGFSLNFRAYN